MVSRSSITKTMEENSHADKSVSNISTESSSPSSTSTQNPSAPPAQDAKKILRETVKGVRTLALESYDGLKEWAQPWSPMERSEGRNDTVEDKKRKKDAREALVKDLMSPFMACHIGSIENTIDFDKTQIGVNSKVHTMEELKKLKDRIFHFTENDSETVLSIDSQAEDEAMQIQRLTSWDTLGTSDNWSAAMSLSMGSMADGEMKMIDDDGNIIPPELVEQVQKRREKRKRARVVRFDYPPIKSLRECPRHNPDDLPNLFFTEEELDEIEADRFSTVIADDIEIVAVGHTRSTSFDRSSTILSPKILEGNEVSHQPSPTQFLKRKPRSSSPHPSRPAKGTYKNQTNSKESDPRLIKGVQIYLRERSTGRGR